MESVLAEKIYRLAENWRNGKITDLELIDEIYDLLSNSPL